MRKSWKFQMIILWCRRSRSPAEVYCCHVAVKCLFRRPESRNLLVSYLPAFRGIPSVWNPFPCRLVRNVFLLLRCCLWHFCATRLFQELLLQRSSKVSKLSASGGWRTDGFSRFLLIFIDKKAATHLQGNALELFLSAAQGLGRNFSHPNFRLSPVNAGLLLVLLQ